MGIHLQNDAVKEKGYGTQAERLILQYAFDAGDILDLYWLSMFMAGVIPGILLALSFIILIMISAIEL